MRLAAGARPFGAAPPPDFAAEADARLRKFNCGPYDVAASAPRIVENFLDMAHFSFVHEGWLGTRGMTAVDACEVECTPEGVRATGCRAWQPQSSLRCTASRRRWNTATRSSRRTPPFSSRRPRPPAWRWPGYRESIALFICPLTPESNRVWFRLAVADFDSPEERLRAFQHTIFMQDKPVLESQRPRRLPLTPRPELHTAADKVSSAYRRYLVQHGVTFGVC